MATWSDAFSTRTTHDLELVLTENSTDSTANTSNVTGRLQINPPSDSQSWNLFSSDNSYSFTFNGTTYTGNFTFDFRTDRSTKTLRSITTNLAHNADGTGSVSAKGSASSATLGSASISTKTLALTDFDRKPAAPPGSPTLSRATTGGSITIVSQTATTPTATPAAPATLYQYQQSTTTSFTGVTPQTLAIPPAGTTVDGLTATQQYYYQTRAVNVDGEGPWSATANYIGAPATPTSLRSGFLDSTATATTATTVALDWGGSTTNVQRYRVSYKRTVDSTWIDTGYSGTTSAYQVTGLTANTLYDFRVSAENTTFSLTSGFATLSTSTVPATPTGLRVGYLDATESPATSVDISLDWNNDTSGITNFTVEYSLDESTWVNTGYSSTTSHYKVTGLQQNTLYYFRVSAVNSTRGTVSGFATISESTIPAGPPVAVWDSGTSSFIWTPSEVFVYSEDEEWTLGSMSVWDGTAWKVVG